MSENYRDDTVEVAVAADQAYGGFFGLVEEACRTSVLALAIGIGSLASASALAQDEVIGRHLLIAEESAAAADLATGAMHTRGLTLEQARASDASAHRLGALLEESAQLADALVYRQPGLLVEQAVAGGDALGTLRAQILVAERAAAGDALPHAVRELLAESAQADDLPLGRARAGSLLLEQAQVTDELLGSAAASAVPAERARAADEVFGALRAAGLLTEAAEVADEVLATVIAGQAWVSEADGWALTRYAPFGFSSATVIDGVVYLTAPDGVYALDGSNEPISARLETGKIDFGQQLARPQHAYLTYELDGRASIEVAQTQGGQAAERWTYHLPDKPASVLTSGRVDFGRGLRGRHFAFTLRLEGQRAHINDLVLVGTATSRRA